MPRHRSLARATAALVAVALLAACGAPAQPTGQGVREVRATVTPFGDEPTLGISLVLLDGAVVNASGLFEAYDGVWLTGAAAPDAEGGVTIDLPDGALVPQALRYPAADLLDPNWIALDCTLEASDPGARLTPVAILQFISFPGFAALSANGAAFTVVTEGPFDLEDDSDVEDALFVTLTHSDAATSVATPPAGCTVGSVDVRVDVELAAGWNQLAWRVTVERDPITDEIIGLTSAQLTNHATSPIHVTVLPDYLWQEFGGMPLGFGGASAR